MCKHSDEQNRSAQLINRLTQFAYNGVWYEKNNRRTRFENNEKMSVGLLAEADLFAFLVL